MYRSSGLGSTTSDLLKIGASLIPAAGAGATVDASAAGGAVTTAALDFLYAKEQQRIQNLLDHSDAVVLTAGAAIDWWKVAGTVALGGIGVWAVARAFRR